MASATRSTQFFIYFYLYPAELFRPNFSGFFFFWGGGGNCLLRSVFNAMFIIYSIVLYVRSQSSMYSSSGHSHFSPPSSGSNNSGGGGVVGIASLSGASFRDLMMVEPLVTSDEGYDERAVDCDSMSSLGSSEFRGTVLLRVSN